MSTTYPIEVFVTVNASTLNVDISARRRISEHETVPIEIISRVKTIIDEEEHRPFNTFVQSFYRGFPDGGSINVKSCCKTHYKPGSKSSWNTGPQRSMEQDAVYMKGESSKPTLDLTKSGWKEGNPFKSCNHPSVSPCTTSCPKTSSMSSLQTEVSRLKNESHGPAAFPHNTTQNRYQIAQSKRKLPEIVACNKNISDEPQAKRMRSTCSSIYVSQCQYTLSDNSSC